MWLSHFFKDRKGGVLPLFSIAIIPVMSLVGAAVDYSRANGLKAKLQSALDSTALALSKSAATSTQQQLQATAQSYFLAVLNAPQAQNVQVIANYSNTGNGNSGSLATLTVSATIKTAFMAVIGIPQLTVSASSSSTWGQVRLRVALALDNTGSMASSGKMPALKTATHSLLNMLQGVVTDPADVYVSIIPFSKDVNADPSNYDRSWINWTKWSAPPASSMPSSSVGPGSSCPYSKNNNGYTCTTGPANGSPNTNTIPSSGTYKGYICPGLDDDSNNYYNGCYNSTTYSCTGSSCTCSGHSNCSCSGSGSSKVCKQPNGYYEHAWIANATSTWNGCVTDRDQNYDTTNAEATPSNTATLYLAEQFSSCPAALKGMTNNWTSLHGLVDQMIPVGNTNQTIGLQWAWQSLSAGEPLSTPAKDPNFQYQDVIILMTDGLNTENRWSTSQSSVDLRTQKACDNIKAAGVIIYTVLVMSGNSTLLKNCASDQSKYYAVNSTTQLVATFETIGAFLAKLHLAK